MTGAASAANGNGHRAHPSGPLQQIPNGYPNGPSPASSYRPEYATGASQAWTGGYPSAGPQPVPGYPGGPAQDRYPDQYPVPVGHAQNGTQHPADGYGMGGPIGPLDPADHPSSPGYAPPDQFDPSQQGYWQ